MQLGSLNYTFCAVVQLDWATQSCSWIGLRSRAAGLRCAVMQLGQAAQSCSCFALRSWAAHGGASSLETYNIQDRNANVDISCRALSALRNEEELKQKNYTGLRQFYLLLGAIRVSDHFLLIKDQISRVQGRCGPAKKRLCQKSTFLVSYNHIQTL